MLDYGLDSDEVVLVECENVTPNDNKIFSSTGNLVLTNKNVLFATLTLFGKVKNVEKHALSDIKIFDNQAQAKLETKFAESPVLSLFFKNFQMGYTIESKAKAKDFVNQLNKIVTGNEAVVTSGIASGASVLGSTLRDTANAFKTAFGIKEKEPEMSVMPCTGCGASVTGVKGSVVKCEFCGCTMKMI